jgi:ubiquinone/menaquinone biosynthesis C-methylase UbiE
LDAGCGVGGPARTLADEFGCRVTAFDLAGEYCRSARHLTHLAGLADMVGFCRADALALPFGDRTFDAVFSQHVTMNIARKGELFSGYRRVLRPDGRLVLYEVCAGPAGPPLFPLPWAENETISFLVTPERLQDLLARAGLHELAWEDVSRPALSWLRDSVARHQTVKQATPRLTPRLLMGEHAAAKASNVSRNLRENRIRLIRAVFTRREN